MTKILKRYYWPVALLLCGAWVLLAFGWMPGAIREAHAGGGIGMLRRAMEQAHQNPVQGYLDQFDAFARLQLFRLVGAFLIGYVVLRLVTAVRAAATGGGGTARVLDPLLIGVWFGLLSGVGEGVYVALRTGVLRRAVFEFTEANFNTAFLAPVTNAITFALLGLLIIAADRGRASRWSGRLATAVFAAVTLAGWTLMAGRLDMWAGIVLSAGVGVQVWRWAGTHGNRFRGYVGPSIVRGAALLAALALLAFGIRWAKGPGGPAPVAGADRPNVLWVVLDTERAKSLELYGHEKETGPALARFAEDAVVFDLAIAPSSWTLPSHASFFTGLPAADLAVWDWSAIPASRTTVAEVLEDNGYQTAGFGGNLIFLNRSFGLTQGFTDWYGTPLALRSLGVSTWLVRTVRTYARKLFGRHTYLIQLDAREINGRVERWLDRRDGERPFFLFVNYYDAHEPYDARPAYLTGSLDGDRLDWLKNGTRTADYGPGEVEGLLDAYESEIRWLDDELDRLLGALAAHGELDRTLVIITSDHGELFGEHGLLDHANSTYRPLIHVPLVLRPPGGVAGGFRVAEPVATENLGASILDLTGVSADGFPGISLARWWNGSPAAPEPVIASQRGWISVLAEGYHYILRGNGREYLFRLADTEEAEDLAESPDHADIRRRLRALLPGDPP